MKWKINEIASLYDISSHTLRYYEEMKLVVPQRGKNNYRIYTEEHLQKLNIIRDLRKFNVPLEQIKDYLDNRTVDKTLNLLQKQMAFLEYEIASLQEKQKRISDRISLFTQSMDVRKGECQLFHQPDRYAIASHDRDIESIDIDLSLKELYKKYESKLPFLDQYMFGSFLYFTGDRDNPALHHRVFYLLENSSDSYTTLIPKGRYASVFYKGSYTQTQTYLLKLKNYLIEHNYEADGDFFETYVIDFHETNSIEQYVTKLEVKIKEH